MKNSIVLYSGLVLLFFVLYFMETPRAEAIPEQRTNTIDTLMPVEVKLVTKYHVPNRGELRKFLLKLARHEASGNAAAVNQFGYMGKYQFGRNTLNALGLEHVTNEEFLANPALQDSAAVLLLKRNERALRHVIAEFHGKTVNGVYVTKSGILAGAHLTGAGGVLTFFYPDRYQFKTVDGNGHSVADYIITFGGYDI